MKNRFLGLLLLALVVASLSGVGVAFQAGALRVSEVDGSPNVNLARWLVFPNSALSCSGDKCTFSGISSSIAGAEAANATLTLQADESDDNGDDWAINSVASGNALTFANDTSGSQVTKLSLSTAGVLTLADSETLTNAGDETTLAADDDAGVFNVTGFEAFGAFLKLKADQGDDNADTWVFESTTDGYLILSNENGGEVMRWNSANGVTQVSQDLIGDGADQLYGFLQNQITSTTTTLTVAQCGSTIINDSADVLTLPEASTALGCRYTFVVNNASNLDINPNDGTDQILPFINAVATDPTLISPSAGDAIRCATIGGSITLEAVGANAWAVVGGVAGHSWSDVN